MKMYVSSKKEKNRISFNNILITMTTIITIMTNNDDNKDILKKY